jgi:uncharacterized protein YigE (DUF2233 family)
MTSMYSTKLKSIILMELLTIMQFSLVASSCAQGNPDTKMCDCVTLLALESWIDNLENSSRKIGSETSVWKDGEIRPSQDIDFMEECRFSTKGIFTDKYCDLMYRKKTEAEAINMKALKDIRRSELMEIRRKRNNDYYTRSDSSDDPAYDSKEIEPDTIIYNNKVDFFSGVVAYPDYTGSENYFNFVIYNPQSKDYYIDFMYKDASTGQTLFTFTKAADVIKKRNATVRMLMNAGIYDTDYKPLGLYISGGKKIREINTDVGDGNFFMQPNGVFYIDDYGDAGVISTSDYKANPPSKVKYATQSGPMLVLDGKINSLFKKKSENKCIRNGVGILPSGKIVFAISEDPVSLYDFALFFKRGFGCNDALYLDGIISRLYLSKSGTTPTPQLPGGSFAGIIAIYKKKTQ